MNEPTLLERCQSALSAAQRHGAQQAEVAAQSVRRVTATISKHDLQIAQSHRETTFGVRSSRISGSDSPAPTTRTTRRRSAWMH
jgi:predicted Zn-dependent protease